MFFLLVAFLIAFRLLFYPSITSGMWALTMQSGKNASINWHCVLSQVTEIQVHKREFKDNDGDSHFTHEIYLDLKGEKVRFPINYLNLESMQFLGEFLDVPVNEIETN